MKKLYPLQHCYAPGDLFFVLVPFAQFIIFGDEDALGRDRKWYISALQCEVYRGADYRVCRRARRQVRQPVARRVSAITFFKIDEYAMGFRLGGSPFEGFGQKRVSDRRY